MVPHFETQVPLMVVVACTAVQQAAGKAIMFVAHSLQTEAEALYLKAVLSAASSEPGQVSVTLSVDDVRGVFRVRQMVDLRLFCFSTVFCLALCL